MGCTKEAIDIFEGERIKGVVGGKSPVWYGPGKAANVRSSLLFRWERELTLFVYAVRRSRRFQIGRAHV